MSNRLNHVRKNLEARRKNLNYRIKQKERSAPAAFNRQKYSKGEAGASTHSNIRGGKPVLEDKGFFLLRIMIAVILFLCVGILFKNGSTQLEPVRQFVSNAYSEEFQFAAIANWYEKQFGQPLALLPKNSDVAYQPEDEEDSPVYAAPASGTIREDFSENGRGILVETDIDAEIEAAKGGIVIAVGEGEEGVGKHVIVQHYDETESTYGMLNDIYVNIYDHIQAGRVIGTASENEQGETGIYYFALKKGDSYINPSDVISFE